MLNRCEFIGHFGKDPEGGMTNSGTPYARVSIAVTEKWKDKTSGEKKESTEWINLTFWKALAEIVTKYCHKGSKVYVSGKFTTRSWENDKGEKKYMTEVVVTDLIMLDAAKGDRAPAPEEPGTTSKKKEVKKKEDQENPNPNPGPVEDDLPF